MAARGSTTWITRLVLGAVLFAGSTGHGAALDAEADQLARALMRADPAAQGKTLAAIEARGGTDLVAPLIQVLRFVPRSGGPIGDTLGELTGEAIGADWHAWMLWQQRHPEIEPYDGFAAFKADVMALIDPDFRVFLQADVAHTIRLEEIAWGGVPKDGIPALVDPEHIEAREADWLEDDELVFGVSIEGDVRAWPLRILDWHEMTNDVVGGVPVALAYCTLCGSGILFATGTEEGGRRIFGSSGFLYRSNKLMYDQATHSLWNQFTGTPVVGPLTASGIELEVLPVAITTWADWSARHPDTLVLSLETGHRRDYTPGRPYGDYFASPDLMFPSVLADASHAAKSYVFALRHAGAEKAWPLAAFEDRAVLNDHIGQTQVVLIGAPESRTVRAYQRGDRTFERSGERTLSAAGESFTIEEDALVGDRGTRLARLPGHIAYWFAWQSFLPEAEVAPEG